MADQTESETVGFNDNRSEIRKLDVKNKYEQIALLNTCQYFICI